MPTTAFTSALTTTPTRTIAASFGVSTPTKTRSTLAVEKRFIRNTGSNTATTDGVSNTNGQGRLLTLILHGGDFVEVQEVNNVSAFADPSTDFRDVATYMQCGSWGLARNTTLTVYTADLSVIVSCVRQTSMYVSAIRLLRWKAS